MNYKLTLFAFLLMSNIMVSQNTILWKVTDTINHKTSFIVGSLHQFGNSFVDAIPQIKEKLYTAELAIFESINIIEDTRKMITKREPSDEIEQRIKEQYLVKLKEITKDWKVDLYKLKPLEIRLKLVQEYVKTKCKTVATTDTFDHFDRYVQRLAEEKGIAVYGLETSSQLLGFIEKEHSSPNWHIEEKTIRYLIEQLEDTNHNQNNCSFIEKYRNFQLDYKFEADCEMEVLIKQRNKNWMEILPQKLREKNCFITVGLLHLYNKCGLLEQLKIKGFKVEAVKLK